MTMSDIKVHEESLMNVLREHYNLARAIIFNVSAEEGHKEH